MSALRVVLLLTHVAVIGYGVLFYVASLDQPHLVGANIGLGLALLYATALGLPWSLPLFTSVDDLSGEAWTIVIFGLAGLNLVLHAILPTMVSRLARARSRQRT